MEKIEIIYDHYKESHALSRETLARRNKDFAILCVFEAVSFLFVADPSDAVNIAKTSISAGLGTSLEFGTAVIRTSLWLFLTFFLIKYVQDTMYIERQYKYIENLEKHISRELEDTLSRESDSYTEKYPAVLNIIDIFYKTFCPLLFVAINTALIVKEWKLSYTVSLALICDSSLYFSIMLIITSYFFCIHTKITKSLRKISFINRFANTIEKILKEV